ncbi:MAG TPA: hypothetical protein DDW27_19805 [Bacteroidales bacterium]|nr:hypothetical protein [Bacteroidales bacterium]
MKLLFTKVLVFISLSLVPSISVGSGRAVVPDRDPVTYISPFQEENLNCFKCHGQEKYEYTNELLGTQVKAIMCLEHIIKSEDFYASNHRSFSCTDCHSEDYSIFPHSGELRMELKYTCLDCHGGDDTFSSFSFEGIDADYRESVHFKLENDGFSCWKCHDPHTYRISIRESKNLKETILYNNNICLHCHSDYSRFHLLTDRDEVNLMKTHDWLPDQASHFRSIRCIECHTRINDSILVAHQVLSKDQAVKLCNECHSRNSMLMVSLYKFHSKEQRRDGFLNGIILNESYVIGANRNSYLGNASMLIFGIVILMILIHIIFRIKRNKLKEG